MWLNLDYKQIINLFEMVEIRSVGEIMIKNKVIKNKVVKKEEIIDGVNMGVIARVISINGGMINDVVD